MDGVLWVNKITYPVELARAIEIAPNNSFVKGAQEFYEQAGYLTPKQRIALSCVMPRRRRRKKAYPWWREDYSDYPGDFGMEWWK